MDEQAWPNPGCVFYVALAIFVVVMAGLGSSGLTINHSPRANDVFTLCVFAVVFVVTYFFASVVPTIRKIVSRPNTRVFWVSVLLYFVYQIPASLVIGTRDMVYRGLIALFFQCPLGFAVFSLITEGSLCRKGPHGGAAAYHEGCYFGIFLQTAISFAIFYGFVSLIGYPLWKEIQKAKTD